MKTMKSLTELTDDMEVEYISQYIEFSIGEKGYLYEDSIERDCEGNITDIHEEEVLEIDPKCDAETWVAHMFNQDPDIWYYLDQHIFDADRDETFTYNVDADEFLKNNFFDENEEKFIKEHTDENGFMQVYITVVENEIFEEE